MDDLVGLVYIAILIALTAFFVVSEFAIVKVRPSRIDQLIEEGKNSAKAAKTIITQLDEYLSACQLGITVTALGLGWIGESTMQGLLSGLFVNVDIPDTLSHALSITLAFLIVTFLHVVIGELAPKTWAIQRSEQITLLISKPLILFYRIMYPFIWVLNGSARLISRMFGLNPNLEKENAHSEEELRIILSESFKSGEINQAEFKYVTNIFEFDDRIAKEIMVPRTEIVSIDINDSLETLKELIKTEKYTRYPITDGDKDHIIGFVNIKELLTGLVFGKELNTDTLRAYIRPIIRVIDTIPISKLLIKMQREQVHIAILMDEYGGTSGLVTIEDIVEEIVGEIRDEFDLDEIPLIRQVSDNHYILDAKVLVSEINELLSIDMNDDDVDTIGGWLLTEKFDARQGDVFYYGDYQFKILEMYDHHIKYIEVMKVENEEERIHQQPLNIPAANTEAL